MPDQRAEARPSHRRICNSVVSLLNCPSGESMPTLIPQATRITAAGNKPKLIDEYIGQVNSKTAGVSVAHMRSPQGWVEPGQTPEFDEFTIVLKGTLRVQHKQGEMD